MWYVKNIPQLAPYILCVSGCGGKETESLVVILRVFESLQEAKITVHLSAVICVYVSIIRRVRLAKFQEHSQKHESIKLI
jgi:hypothetical protein